MDDFHVLSLTFSYCICHNFLCITDLELILISCESRHTGLSIDILFARFGVELRELCALQVESYNDSWIMICASWSREVKLESCIYQNSSFLIWIESSHRYSSKTQVISLGELELHSIVLELEVSVFQNLKFCKLAVKTWGFEFKFSELEVSVFQNLKFRKLAVKTWGFEFKFFKHVIELEFPFFRTWSFAELAMKTGSSDWKFHYMVLNSMC